MVLVGSQNGIEVIERRIRCLLRRQPEDAARVRAGKWPQRQTEANDQASQESYPPYDEVPCHARAAGANERLHPVECLHTTFPSELLAGAPDAPDQCSCEFDHVCCFELLVRLSADSVAPACSSRRLYAPIDDLCQRDGAGP